MEFPKTHYDCRCQLLEIELWRKALEINNLKLKLNDAVKREDYLLAHDLKTKINTLIIETLNK